MRSIAPLGSGSEFLGRYRIIQVLGAGRNGQISAAERLPEGERCALETLSASLVAEEELRAAFVDEIKNGAGAKSSHLARVLEAGIDDATGQPWVATELLPGKDLAERVRLWGRIELSDVERVVRGVADALGAALAIGLVHHDLAPRFVHLSPDEPPHVKLRGLGVSRFIARARAGEQPPYLSAHWMAPEQLEAAKAARRGAIPGGTPDAASNVWSLGLITFYALTGRPYWTHPEDAGEAALHEVLSETIAPASERARSLGREDALPDWFDAWFAKCVARNPRQRFVDARAAAAAWATVGRASFDDEQRATLPRVGDDDENRLTLPVARKLPPPTPPPRREPAPPPALPKEASPAIEERRGDAAAAPPVMPAGRDLAEPRRRFPIGPAIAVAAVGAVGLWLWGMEKPDVPDVTEVTTSAASAAPPASAGPPSSASLPSEAAASAASSASPTPSGAAGATPGPSASANVVSVLEGSDYDLDAALKSLNKVYYGECHVASPGRLLIQFAPNGTVKQVKVAEGDFDPATTSCLEARFRTATMPPFEGKPHFVTAAVVAAP